MDISKIEWGHIVMKWTFEEDYIICNFCEEHKYRTIADERLDELMEKLVGAGFDTRSKAAVNRRANDYQSLLCGWSVAHIPAIQKERCESFVRRKQKQERHRGLELFLDSRYVSSEADPLEAIATTAPSVTALLPIDSVGPTFLNLLYTYIDQRNMKDSEIYKRAQISRATFSNIRSGKKGISKQTLMQLCFGLKLSYDESVALMAAADCAFNTSNIRDLVVIYFLKNGIYDTYEVNAELYERNQPLLFSGKMAYYN